MPERAHDKTCPEPMCPDGLLQTVAMHRDTKPPLPNRVAVLAVADAGECDLARLEQPTVWVFIHMKLDCIRASETKMAASHVNAVWHR